MNLTVKQIHSAHLEALPLNSWMRIAKETSLTRTPTSPILQFPLFCDWLKYAFMFLIGWNCALWLGLGHVFGFLFTELWLCTITGFYLFIFLAYTQNRRPAKCESIFAEFDKNLIDYGTFNSYYVAPIGWAHKCRITNLETENRTWSVTFYPKTHFVCV